MLRREDVSVSAEHIDCQTPKRSKRWLFLRGEPEIGYLRNPALAIALLGGCLFGCDTGDSSKSTKENVVTVSPPIQEVPPARDEEEIVPLDWPSQRGISASCEETLSAGSVDGYRSSTTAGRSDGHLPFPQSLAKGRRLSAVENLHFLKEQQRREAFLALFARPLCFCGFDALLWPGAAGSSNNSSSSSSAGCCPWPAWPSETFSSSLSVAMGSALPSISMTSTRRLFASRSLTSLTGTLCSM